MPANATQTKNSSTPGFVRALKQVCILKETSYITPSTHTRAYINAHVYTHTQAYTHVYTHTYVYTHTNTKQSLWLCLLVTSRYVSLNRDWKRYHVLSILIPAH